MIKSKLLKGFIFLMTFVLIKVLVVGCTRRGGSDIGTGGSDTGTGNIVDIVSKSKSSVFCRAELEEIYEVLKTEFENKTISEMTYEEVRDTYFGGEEGENDTRESNRDAYYWYSNDDEWASLSVFFEDSGDRIRTASGVKGNFPDW